jgi:hypothetical protein
MTALLNRQKNIARHNVNQHPKMTHCQRPKLTRLVVKKRSTSLLDQFIATKVAHGVLE